MKPALLASVLAVSLGGPIEGRAQSMTDCKVLFIAAMPESLNMFLTAELMKAKLVTITTNPSKAHCILRFPSRDTSISLKSDGGMLPEGEVTLDEISRLPQAGPRHGFADHRSAAVELVHRESEAVIWAAAKANVLTTGGAKELARKLGKEFVKNYKKAK